MCKVNQLRTEQEQEVFDSLLSALEPFARAFQRLNYYDPDGKDIQQDTRLMAMTDDWNQFELFADEGEATGCEPKTLLAVGHLANACQIWEAYSNG